MSLQVFRKEKGFKWGTPLAGSICTSVTGPRKHAGKGMSKQSGATCNLSFNKNADEQKILRPRNRPA